MNDPWWAALDWKAIGGLLAGIGVVSSPFFAGWWQNRSKSIETTAQKVATEQQRLDKIGREQFEREQERAEEAENAASKMRAQRDLANELTDQMTATARAMEDWAHFFRHDLLNVNTNMIRLVEITEVLIRRVREALTTSREDMNTRPEIDWSSRRATAGQIESAIDSITVVLDGVRIHPPNEPPRVPSLRDVAKTTPPRN